MRLTLPLTILLALVWPCLAHAQGAPADSAHIYGGPASQDGRFETAAGVPDWQGWTTHDLSGGALPAGDFAKLLVAPADLDPCAGPDNVVAGFVDDGSSPANYPGQSTGGESSPTWTYAPWVVNHSGGLGSGEGVHNEIWSPVIAWDLPGTADDDLGPGARLEFDLYEHNPAAHGMFWTWRVRSSPDPATGGWSPWYDRGLWYLSDDPQWRRAGHEIGDLLVPNAREVQVALGVVDMSGELDYPGGDSTPAPYFDNVAVIKYRQDGPRLVLSPTDLLHNAFPLDGMAITSANLADQALRVDSGVSYPIVGAGIATGDSLVVVAQAGNLAQPLSGAPVLHWVLRTNPLFDPFRTLPGGATVRDPGFWEGQLSGRPVAVGSGTPDDHKWFFDLPDGPARPSVPEADEPGFFYPGDRLYTFVGLSDVDDILWWPGDPDSTVLASGELCGEPQGPQPAATKPGKDPPVPKEDDGTGGVPEVWEAPPQRGSGDHGLHFAPLLLWDDSGDPDELAAAEAALAQLGWLRGRDWALYRSVAPSSGWANGLGASGGHGATAAQLQEASCVLYLGGSQSVPLISDGSGLRGNDLGDDIGLLRAWLAQGADRSLFVFADNIGEAMSQQGLVPTGFLEGELGLRYLSHDIRPAVGGQDSPAVFPSGALPALFAARYAVDGACAPLRLFDELGVSAPAVASHLYQLPGGGNSAAVAGVWHAWEDTTRAGLVLDRQVAAFGHAFSAVVEITGSPSGSTLSARTRLLSELLLAAGHSATGGASDVPLPVGAVALAAPWPNPFNPATTISMELGRAAVATLELVDLRGRRVRVLHRGELASGRHIFRWDGRDDGGRRVASGAYLVVLRAAGEQRVRRVLLIE